MDRLFGSLRSRTSRFGIDREQNLLFRNLYTVKFVHLLYCELLQINLDRKQDLINKSSYCEQEK